MNTRVKFRRIWPLPAYMGPRPVYLCTFPWGGQRCWVRKNDGVWETAEVTQYVQDAKFSASPVASAFARRYDAVMAFDFYYNQGAR